MMKNLFTTLSVLLLACCGTKETSEIPVLDVTRSYTEKDVVLQNIADVEYIVLESADDFLVDNTPVRYMDDDILRMNNQSGDIMTFDRRTGKALHSFNRTGRGPGEYSDQPGEIAVDRESNEIFVTESVFSGGVTIYVYDLQGNHLRTLEYSGLNWPRFLHNYDDGHLMMYDQGLSMPEQGTTTRSVTVPEPFILISKTDTVTSRLPIRFEGRDHMSVTYTIEEGNGVITNAPFVNIFTKTGGGYIISETGIDTVYRWDKAAGTLAPLMARTPAFHSMKIPVGLYCEGESRDYLFMRTIEREYDFGARRGFDAVPLIYDKTDGGFYEGEVVNGDFADRTAIAMAGRNSLGLPPGVIVASFEPYRLIELGEEGKLRGKLAEIVASGKLKEDDNPVLMIATLKQ